MTIKKNTINEEGICYKKRKKRRKEETNTSQQQKLSTKLSHSIFRITSNFFIYIAKYTKKFKVQIKK